MLILNRFLNVINLLLAIAACVTAVLLNKRRIELRERADIFAEIRYQRNNDRFGVSMRKQIGKENDPDMTTIILPLSSATNIWKSCSSNCSMYSFMPIVKESSAFS